jgi:uncharacterized membrane protein
MMKVSFLIISFVFFISSCSYRKEKIGQSEVLIDQSMLQKVSYQLVNEKILTPKCVTCHGNAGNVNLETYSAVYGYIDKIKEAAVTNSTMPKAPFPALSDEERSLLATWIKAGAPDKALDGTDSPPTPPVIEPLMPTFVSIKKHILQNKCLSCHSVGNVAEDISLLTAQEMIDSPRSIVVENDPDSSELYLSTAPTRRRKFMPPKTSGITPLTAEERDVIRQWIQSGAKD